MAIVTGGNTEPNPNESNKNINSKESVVGLRRESIAANTLEQAYITNNFLKDILDTNKEGVRLQQSNFNWQISQANKLSNKREIALQESGIEQQRGGKGSPSGMGKPGFGIGGKGLGTGRVGWKDGLLALGLLGPALLRLSKGVESATGSFTGLNTRQGIMGFNQAMKGVTPFHQSSFNKVNPKITGLKSLRTGVLGADPTDYSMLGPNVGRKIRQVGARTTLKGIKGVGTGIENIGKGGIQNFFKGAFGKDLADFRKFLRTSTVQPSASKPGLLFGARTANKFEDVIKSFGSIKNIPARSWKGISDTFKGFKDLSTSITKAGAANIKAFINAPMQGIGKGLTATGTGLKNLPGQAFRGWAGATKNLSQLTKGPKVAKGVQVLRNTGTLARRIPVLGSLLSAGIGAMDANEEEMQRLREENPSLTNDQINSRLKDGRLKKDKNKIIGRSAGAGIGAGTGTVLGGLLGSFAGPIGTAIGAALGAWIGENIGKFFGEGLFSVFKGFDWGETFRPVVETWNELTAGIGASFQSISEAFGVGEGKNGFIEGLKNLGKVLGIFAKVLLKTLIPLIQMTLKSIQLVVQSLLKVVEASVWVMSKIMGGIRRLLNLVGNIPGMGFLKDATGEDASMSGFLDDVSGSLDNVNTGIPRMGDHDNDNNSSSSGTGESDRGFQTGDPSKTGGGYGGDGIEPTIQRPYLTSGFKPSHRPNHQGIDVGFLGDRGGQPLFLPSKAKVTGNGFDPKGYGNWVTFTTQGDGITHLYGHMQKKSPLQMGKVFSGGTYAGAVGNTGGSDGAHLHWETGTIENQVGYPGGKGLRDPRSFGYGLSDPFKKATSNMQSSLNSSGSNLDGMSTNTSNSGNAISSNSSSKVDDASHQAQALSGALSAVNPAGSTIPPLPPIDSTSLTASGSVNLSTKPGWSDNSEVFTYSNN